MKSWAWMWLSLALIFQVAGPVAAEEAPPPCPICRRANNQHAPYLEKAGSTLARGATNTMFGWTELLLQPTEEVNHGGNLVVGIGKGVGNAVKRTALGLGELLTFWTPKSHDHYLSLTTNCPICFSASQQPHPNTPAAPKR